MGGFLLRKAGAALIVVFLSSIVVFIGIRALPGDPAVALGAENRDPAVMAAIRHSYGLDKPLPVQYVKWISKALRGDLGLDARCDQAVDGERKRVSKRAAKSRQDDSPLA
jgi:peptide/nickel transport system permease protein